MVQFTNKKVASLRFVSNNTALREELYKEFDVAGTKSLFEEARVSRERGARHEYLKSIDGRA